MLLQSIREMTFFKVRYLLIIFILFFVSALVFIINGLANGLSMDNASSIKKMNAEAIYLQKDSENRLDRSKFKMADIDNALFSKSVQPLSISMTSMKQENTDKNIDMTVIAAKPSSFLVPKVTEGKKLNAESENGVIVDQELKDEGITIGTRLKDERTGTWLKVVGFTDKQTFSHTPVAFMSFETWKELAGKNGEPFYSGFVLKKGDSSLKNELEQLINDGRWVDKEAVVKGIPGYEAEQNSLNMMLGFLIVIAVFVIAAFFYIMTIQKINQFGILKAIGAKTSLLIKSTMFQVFILTFISIAGAIGLTKLIFLLLPENIPFVFEMAQILKFSLVIAVVSLFGSLISTFNIVKADPIQAMGRVE